MARTAAWIGAVGSAALVIYAGRHNGHPFLVVLFVLWVSAPFAAFLSATRMAQRWPSVASPALDAVVVLAALASLAVYTYATLRPGRAVPFVVVPVGAWVLMLIVVGAAAVTAARRRPGGSQT